MRLRPILFLIAALLAPPLLAQQGSDANAEDATRARLYAWFDSLGYDSFKHWPVGLRAFTLTAKRDNYGDGVIIQTDFNDLSQSGSPWCYDTHVTLNAADLERSGMAAGEPAEVLKNDSLSGFNGAIKRALSSGPYDSFDLGIHVINARG